MLLNKLFSFLDVLFQFGDRSSDQLLFEFRQVTESKILFNAIRLIRRKQKINFHEQKKYIELTYAQKKRSREVLGFSQI